MIKFTSALKKAITTDWQALLPQFAAFRPMEIARRIGPLVQGICLDRDSTDAAYLPTLHVHCLCRPFPVLSLSLGQPLLSVRSGSVERLSVEFHEKKYKEACAALVAASLLPVEGDWHLSKVCTAYEQYRTLQRSGARYPILLMEDAVSVCAWLGGEGKASELALRCIEEAGEWPAGVWNRAGGYAEWSRNLKVLAISGERLRQVASEQIVALKLQSLPVSELLP